ncbi:MAG: TonB-dependent receptor [Vicinamibacteria bacterium]|nr:TonB-dependent receptor [Vicinamibacteria bacterium]
MKRHFFAIALMLVLGLPAFAEPEPASITGVVNDETGAALPGATVNASGPGGAHMATTGADGRFTITGLAAGNYRVTADLMGFKAQSQTVTVSATSGVNLSFGLGIALRGEEVVVSASKSETSIVDAPATLSVVSSEQILASPAQNMGDLLRSVPGVNIIQTSARDINITARQGTSTLSSSQLALLDGRSIYLDFFGLIVWELVPNNPADIKQIEVVRGPASAVWGANALTGVVNIITKTPRENPGGYFALSGGLFDRDLGTTSGEDAGQNYGAQFGYAGAPNDTLSYRLTASYFKSDPYARPSGTVPLGSHPLDASFRTGGAPYPNFANNGTEQPKVDLRVDRETGNGGTLGFAGGYVGTQGIVHTGIGPFNLQDGAYMAYGRAGYRKGAFKTAMFANYFDGEAPNLLSVDARTGRPLVLGFKTGTYDFEIGNSNLVGGRHVLTYGGNVRRNTFDLTIAPAAEDRTEIGAYFQEEFFVDKFRLAAGIRVDKFGNIDDPVFSPRVTAMFKPSQSHSFRVSYNKAFRSPSAINNYLDVNTVTGQLPLGLLNPVFGNRVFNVVTRSAGSAVPQLGEPSGHELKEEALTAYEIGYTGTFNGRTTVGLAAYINDTDDNINFVTDTCRKRYSAANPPPGWSQALSPFIPAAVAPLIVEQLRALGVCLPAEFTYLNLGSVRNVGFEASIDHAFSRELSAYANYSWQDDPEPEDVSEYPYAELSLSPKHRFNVGMNFNNDRWVVNANVNYASEAFWTDVLGPTFNGPTEAYTLVNASIGLKWNGGKIVTSVKGTNLLNEEIQQHNFGDYIMRNIVGEVRFTF